MTDISEQIDHLKANVDLNINKGSCKDNEIYNNCSIRCIPLMFGSTILQDDYNNYFPQISHYDVILGSDIGFDVSLHSLLAKSVYCFSSEFSVTLIAEEVRWKDIYAW